MRSTLPRQTAMKMAPLPPSTILRNSLMALVNSSGEPRGSQMIRFTLLMLRQAPLAWAHRQCVRMRFCWHACRRQLHAAHECVGQTGDMRRPTLNRPSCGTIVQLLCDQHSEQTSQQLMPWEPAHEAAWMGTQLMHGQVPHCASQCLCASPPARQPSACPAEHSWV